MMNKMILTAVAATILAAGNAYAQSQYGAVENFYQANIDIANGQYAGRVVNPAYWLVDSSQLPDVNSRWIENGYVRLGASSWISDNALGGGAPVKYVALAYAKAIGADVVIYNIEPAAEKYNWTSHTVTFYAKQNVPRANSVSRPSSAQATAAINRAQDAWHEPHVKGGVYYDPQTDTYNWIGPKFGEHRSKPASWFLDKFGSYL